MTGVRNGHVLGLTPAVSPSRPAGAAAKPETGGKKPVPVRNGHVRGLTPRMARGDGIG